MYEGMTPFEVELYTYRKLVLGSALLDTVCRNLDTIIDESQGYPAGIIQSLSEAYDKLSNTYLALKEEEFETLRRVHEYPNNEE